ncbi:MAG: hypothetical protein WHS64_03345 [Fervidobacterium sp.]|uniref:hypothetical protein n=1 Tax=Fervidobacterium sp. TaxID=1871331 RepID=UPI0030ABAC2A
MKPKFVNENWFVRFSRTKNQNTSSVLTTTNLVLIGLNIFSILTDGLRLENFIVIGISAVLFYLQRKNISETFVFVLAYPFSWLFFIPLKNEEIEDFFNIPIPLEIRLNIEEKILTAMPVKTLLVIGNPDEKKEIARNIYKYVVKGIDIEENMKYLRMLLRDSHMDVTLIAGQVLEDIENYFESRKSKTKDINNFESCLNIYYYLRTEIPKGILREELKELLSKKLNNLESKIPVYFEMLCYLTGDENYYLIGYEKTREPVLLRNFLLSKLSKREYDIVKSHLSPETKSLICKSESAW